MNSGYILFAECKENFPANVSVNFVPTDKEVSVSIYCASAGCTLPNFSNHSTHGYVYGFNNHHGRYLVDCAGWDAKEGAIDLGFREETQFRIFVATKERNSLSLPWENALLKMCQPGRFCSDVIQCLSFNGFKSVHFET